MVYVPGVRRARRARFARVLHPRRAAAPVESSPAPRTSPRGSDKPERSRKSRSDHRQERRAENPGLAKAYQEFLDLGVPEKRADVLSDSEALAAFGDGTVFIERLKLKARQAFDHDLKAVAVGLHDRDDRGVSADIKKVVSIGGFNRCITLGQHTEFDVALLDGVDQSHRGRAADRELEHGAGKENIVT